MSALEKIRERYAKTEVVVDALGRKIRVRKLDGAQRLTVREWTDSNREDVILHLILGASVQAIDDIPIPFPKSRDVLNGTLRTLDDEGIMAVADAYQRFNDNKTEEEKVEEAKKSQGIPSFE